MGPHHLQDQSSKFFPHNCNQYHQQQKFLAMLLLYLVTLSSCGAITTTNNVDKKISSVINTTTTNNNTTLYITTTSIKFNLVNESTFLKQENNETKRPPTLLLLSSSESESESFPIKTIERQVRESGWVWSDPTTTGKPLKNAPLKQGISNKKGSPGKTDAEGRGYYTFGDWTTPPWPPTVPSTTFSNACVCVPYYLCDEGQVVTIIDIRHGWGCNSVLEVCCRNPKPTVPTTSQPDPTPVPTSPPITVQPGYVPQCGTLNPNGVNARILGFKDSESQFGEFPHMAAILESKLIRGKWVLQFICGASLITPRVVVSAAHCIKGKRASKLIIRLGEWDTQSTNEFYPYQDIQVAEFLVHPQFYSGGLYNDIALVFLRTSAILAPHIDTICLPRVTPSYDPTSCWATGWGKNSFGPSGQYQAILREVELGITPSDACQTALRKTNLGSKFNLHSSFICAGGQKDLDTCIGDGGGPLICPSLYDPWRYVLVGIVSWGVKCGTYGVPGVYTNVPKFRPWIDSEILKRFPYYNATRWTLPLPPQGG